MNENMTPPNKDQFLKLSLNDHVYLKLTELGWQQYAAWYNAPFLSQDKNKITIEYLKKGLMDENGYIEMQLHFFMELFGKDASSNSLQNNFFGINIFLKKKELKNSE